MSLISTKIHFSYCKDIDFTSDISAKTIRKSSSFWHIACRTALNNGEYFF